MSNILNLDFLNNLALAAVRMATPLLLVALAELYSERVGLVNIGLDGLMTIGACGAFLGGYITGNPYIGLLIGALAGIAVNMIFAFSTITLCAVQTVQGMALNILAPALATYMYRGYFGVDTTLKSGKTISNLSIPILKDIPILGYALGRCSPVTYMAIAILLITVFFFKKTRIGLNYRSVGDFPQACDTMGINVIRYKYIGCVICGALSGLGGAFLVTCYISSYSNGVVGGRGFIALAAVIFGGWHPVGILLATLFFGFIDGLQLRMQLIYPGIPYQFFSMLPYFCTLVTLAFLGKRHLGPKSVGKEYIRGAK